MVAGPWDNNNNLRPRGESYWYHNSSTTFRRGQRPSPQLERLLSRKPHFELTGSIALEGQYSVYNGFHSDCWRATWNGQPVRAKVLRYIGHISDVEKSSAFEAGVIKEMEKWDGMSHPNVLPFLGCARGFGSMVTLISPWIPAGTAPEYLKLNPSADRLKMVAGIADGLTYLHSRDVVHGDLRGSNVLIHIAETGPVPKLSDAGLNIATGFDGSLEHEQGAERWASIQCLGPGNTDDDSSEILTKEGDIWSWGMTVYELFSGIIPYSEVKSLFRLTWIIRRGTLPAYPGSPAAEWGLSKDVWQVVESCWVPEKTRRPTAAQVSKEIWALGNSS